MLARPEMSALAMVISLVATAVNQAYSPWLFRRLAAPTDALRRKLVLATYLYFVAALLGASIFTVLGPWFVTLFLGDRYSDAAEFLAWMAFGAAFNGSSAEHTSELQSLMRN